MALALAALSGSEIPEDRTPGTIFLEMHGRAGGPARVIYSTQFVAGVNGSGAARVQVVRSDAVVHEMPDSRATGISVDRSRFVQAASRRVWIRSMHA